MAIGELVPPRIRNWPRAFVVSSASHVDVLPLCACVVHHGGAGTCAAAVTARVPSMIVPHLTWIDQGRWARWVEDAHAGVYVRDGQRSPSDFATALDRVLYDETLRDGARSLAKSLEADRGVEVAVQLIEQRLLASRQVPPRVDAAADDTESRPMGSSSKNCCGASLSVGQLVSIAQEISGDDGFGADTPLFELSSLEVLELHVRIERCTVTPPPRAIMLEQYSLRALAALVAKPPKIPGSIPGGATSVGGPSAGIVSAGAASKAMERLLAGASRSLGLRSSTGGPTMRQRCLFLHGEGASAKLQRGWLERTGWLGCLSDARVDLVLIDANVMCGPKPQLVPPHALDDYLRAGTYYGWGGSAHLEALEASLRHVEAAIRDHAPIDAIGGFSQGALVAAAVAASKQVSGLRWFLNVCGMPWQWLHVSVRTHLSVIALPSLHVISEEDPTLSREQIHSLPSRCRQPVVMLHQHAHTLPRLSTPLAERVTAFLKHAHSSRIDASHDHAEYASGDDGGPKTREVSDAFLWRKMVERQRRWYEQDAAGGFKRDCSYRFVPTLANPLPMLSPQDKLMQRHYLVRRCQENHQRLSAPPDLLFRSLCGRAYICALLRS